MNKWSIGVLAAVLIVAAGCAPKADAPEDVAAIKAMADAWGPDITSGNVAALMEQFADNAVRLPPNDRIVVGKEAIRSNLQAFVDRYSQKEIDVAEDVRVVGDLAIARGTGTAKVTPKVPGAAIFDDNGKWVDVYQRQSDGSWKIIIDIWNSDLPAVQTLSPASADEQALLQLERDWMAAVPKLDIETVEAILADDCVVIFNGQTMTKKQYIAEMKSGIYKIESAEVSDMRAVVFGDQAVVNGISTLKYTMSGKEVSGKNRWTDVYEKRDGRWRAVVGYNFTIE